MNWALCLVPLAAVAAGGIYVFHIRPKAAEIKATIGNHAADALSRGKTLLLTTVAMGAQLVQYVDETAVSSLSQVPWANLLDAKTANLITTLCLLGIPLTHMLSLAQAAKAKPLEDK